jgi:hypothetical protein
MPPMGNPPPPYDRPNQQITQHYNAHGSRPPPPMQSSLEQMPGFPNYGMLSNRPPGQQYPLPQVCPPPQMCPSSSVDAVRMGHAGHPPTMLALPAPPGPFDCPAAARMGVDGLHQQQVMAASMYPATHRPDHSVVGGIACHPGSRQPSRHQVPCISPADRALAAYNPGAVNQQLLPFVGAEAPPLHVRGSQEMRPNSEKLPGLTPSLPASAIVKSSSSPTRPSRTRPRVEHIDLCGDDSPDDGTNDAANSDLPASSILIQPESIDADQDHHQIVEFDRHDGTADFTDSTALCSSVDNCVFETDFTLPPPENIREILPQASDEEDDAAEFNSGQLRTAADRTEENVESSCPPSLAAGLSDSGRSTGSDRVDADEPPPAGPDRSRDRFAAQSAVSVDSEVDGARLSADESQAMVGLYFDSEMNELRCEPPADDLGHA